MTAAGTENLIRSQQRLPRLAFVGVGWIGIHRLESIAEAGVAKVAAVCDVRAPQHEAIAGIPFFDSYEDMLEQSFDGVVIATPNALHAEQAIAALQVGMPVFCQKPLGRNAYETANVVKAAHAADCLLGVDLSYRFIPGMQRIREVIRGGELGRVFAVDLKFHNGYGPDKPWFFDRRMAGGGCLLDLGIHLLDLACWSIESDEITEAQARRFSKGELITSADQDVEDYAAVELRTLDDVVINLQCSWNLNLGMEAQIELAFYGTKGGAALRNVNGSFFDFKAEQFTGTTSKSLSTAEDSGWKWGGLAAIDWCRRLAVDPTFDPGISSIVTVAEVIDRIYALPKSERRQSRAAAMVAL